MTIEQTWPAAHLNVLNFTAEQPQHNLRKHHHHTEGNLKTKQLIMVVAQLRATLFTLKIWASSILLDYEISSEEDI